MRWMMNYPCSIPQLLPCFALMAPVLSKVSNALAIVDLLKIPLQFNFRSPLRRSRLWKTCCLSTLKVANVGTPMKRVVPFSIPLVQFSLLMCLCMTLPMPEGSNGGGLTLLTQVLTFLSDSSIVEMAAVLNPSEANVCNQGGKAQTLSNAFLNKHRQTI